MRGGGSSAEALRVCLVRRIHDASSLAAARCLALLRCLARARMTPAFVDWRVWIRH